MAELTRPTMYRLGDSKPKLYDGADSLEALAYHESGHAILCRLIGRSFQVIVMGEDGGYVGNGAEEVGAYYQRVTKKDATLLKAKPIGFQGELLRPLAARKICALLAGLQGELLLSGEQVEEVYRDDFDHRNARQFAEEAFGTESLQYLQALTRDFLQRCRAELERTASELLTRFDRYGFAVIRKSNPGDVSFFARDTLPVEWTDEQWD